MSTLVVIIGALLTVGCFMFVVYKAATMQSAREIFDEVEEEMKNKR